MDELDKLLRALVGGFNEQLAANLIGVYLHGSLAMGCFNPRLSDVDLLVVVGEKLPVTTKQAIGNSLLSITDQLPRHGIELSIVTLAAVQQFQYPTPYELHFSDAWKARYRAEAVNFHVPMFDPGLAAHFRVTLRRGVCLYGRPIAEVFREIPDEDFEKSIVNDAQDILVDIGKNPVYGVLNLCRLLAYLAEKQVLSKDEGGEWGLEHLDAQFRAVIGAVLGEYRSHMATQPIWDKIELERFAEYASRLLAKCIAADLATGQSRCAGVLQSSS